jgi:hypothetical protein
MLSGSCRDRLPFGAADRRYSNAIRMAVIISISEWVDQGWHDGQGMCLFAKRFERDDRIGAAWYPSCLISRTRSVPDGGLLDDVGMQG